MTKNKKHEPSIQVDDTCTTVTVYDLKGEKNVFDITNIYEISILNVDWTARSPYLLKYMYYEGNSMHVVPINDDQFYELRVLMALKSDYINKIIQINSENYHNIKVEVKDIVGLIYFKFNDTEYDGRILYQVTLQTAPNHLDNYNITINEWLNLKELLDYYVEETHSKKKVAKSIEPDNEYSQYSSRFSITYDWEK